MAGRMSVDERRAKLVEAAITAMSRDGVAHTTTRSIVAEAGMQVGMFHYCFQSKDELVLEVMQAITRRNFDAIAAALAETSDPAEMIRSATQAYWAHIRSNPSEHLVTYELTQYALRQPGAEEAARAQYTYYFEGIEALVQMVAEVGGVTWRRPPAQVARYILATVEGITFQWLVNQDDAMASLLFDALVDHLVADAGLAPG